MRDPQASLEFSGSRVVRKLHAPLDDGHFLKSALARSWIDSRRLVAHRLEDELTVAADRLAFVSYPHDGAMSSCIGPLSSRSSCSATRSRPAST